MVAAVENVAVRSETPPPPSWTLYPNWAAAAGPAGGVMLVVPPAIPDEDQFCIAYGPENPLATTVTAAGPVTGSFTVTVPAASTSMAPPPAVTPDRVPSTPPIVMAPEFQVAIPPDAVVASNAPTAVSIASAAPIPVDAVKAAAVAVMFVAAPLLSLMAPVEVSVTAK